ncbi:MAG: S8 family serine peptidase [Halanaerobiales bacterium]|nr:S8 family serine peptidase [Halanaerobiales bacterium]
MKKSIIFLVLFSLLVLIGCTVPDLNLSTYKVSGTVYDALHTPIPYASVEVGNNNTTTDSHGRYSFSGLKNGSYQLRCSKTGFETFVENIYLSNGDLTKDITLNAVSSQDYTLTVLSVNENSNSPVTATVTLKDSATSQVISTKTGSQVAFNNLPVGNYQVFAEAQGYFSETIINIAVNNNTNVTVQLTPKQTYSIRVHTVVGQMQLTSATVNLVNPSTNQILYTRVGSDVTFSDLTTGSYRVDVSHPDCYIDSKDVVISDVSQEVYFELQWLPASVSGSVSFSCRSNSYTAKKYNAFDYNFETYGLPEFSLLSEDNVDGLLVKFYDDVTEDEIHNILSKYDGYFEIGYGLYKINTMDNLYLIVEELEAEEKVQYVQMNYVSQLMSVTPNDYYYYLQWNLEMINMPVAWEYIKGSYDNSVIVAVLDTGILYNTDLSSNLLPGYDVVDNDNNPTDDVTLEGQGSHGTHCSSIIGAVTNNSEGIAGVGWNISVLPIKVFRNENGEVICYDNDVISGIYKAIELGAKVISMSLGTHGAPNPEQHPAYEDALKYAQQQGVLVVAATGNEEDNYLSYPASSNYTVAVGAVDMYGNRASYSNYGSGIDITAPGGGASNDSDWIWGYVTGYPYDDVANIGGMCGTSQATPHVAAVAGLLYSLGMTDPFEIYALLVNTAQPKSDTYQYGAGILDAGAAVTIAAGSQEPQVSITEANIFAATYADNKWYTYTDPVNPDANGFYSLSDIPPYYNMYIIGWIDVDDSNSINEGDYFGSTNGYYNYAPKESLSQVNFELTKIEYNTNGTTQSSIIRQENTLTKKR